MEIEFVLPWTYFLTGVVRDPDGRGVEDAWVSAHDDTWPGWTRGVATDAGGRFAIHGCPDEAALRVELRAGRADPFPVTVQREARVADAPLEFALDRRSRTRVHGRLERADGGDPAALELRLQHVTSALRQRLTSGPGALLDVEAGGTFALEDVPPGRYSLTVWNEKFPEVTRPVTVGGESVRADVVLGDGPTRRSVADAATGVPALPRSGWPRPAAPRD